MSTAAYLKLEMKVSDLLRAPQHRQDHVLRQHDLQDLEDAAALGELPPVLVEAEPLPPLHLALLGHGHEEGGSQEEEPEAYLAPVEGRLHAREQAKGEGPTQVDAKEPEGRRVHVVEAEDEPRLQQQPRQHELRGGVALPTGEIGTPDPN